MDFKRAMCISCNEYFSAEKMYGKYKTLGVCENCFSKIELTGKTMCFDAYGHSKYLLSPIYYTKKFREIFADFKFRRSSSYANVFFNLLDTRIEELGIIRDFDMIVPVPISKQRFNQRGYNQSLIIAKPIADYFNIPICDNVIMRSKHTNKQSKLSRLERSKNVKDAFIVTEDVKNKRIVLFDDVYTSGNTASSCAKTLIDAGADEVIIISLAVVKRANELVFQLIR